LQWEERRPSRRKKGATGVTFMAPILHGRRPIQPERQDKAGQDQISADEAPLTV
jgi:hypothetical protein